MHMHIEQLIERFFRHLVLPKLKIVAGDLDENVIGMDDGLCICTCPMVYDCKFILNYKFKYKHLISYCQETVRAF